jgi:hypothetical protein
MGDAVTPRSRPTSGGRHSHGSPEANSSKETYSWLMARLRPTPDKQHIFDSLESIYDDAPECDIYLFSQNKFFGQKCKHSLLC